MSTLVIDTIQGKTTAGSINVRGEGSNNTNLQQGLAKSFLRGSGSASLQHSFNIASGTDNGTGDYTYTFINNMNQSEYPVSANSVGNVPRIGTSSNMNTSSYDTDHHTDAGANVDSGNVTVTFGDLA